MPRVRGPAGGEAPVYHRQLCVGGRLLLGSSWDREWSDVKGVQPQLPVVQQTKQLGPDP